MQRRLKVLGIGGVALLAAVRLASAQTVDELVDKNLAAKGGLERLRAVQTVRQTSRMTMQGIEAEFTMFGKRPNLIRQQISMQGQTIVMAYDGAVPWMLNPLLGSSSAILVTGPQAAMIREQSSFDGPLVDYKERGTKVELVGAETVGTRKAYHLKLTSKTGQIQHCYLDAATYLEMRLVSEDMGKMEQELSDYREVEGIKIPFRVRLMQNGVVQSEIKVDKVEFNVKVEDSLFRIPK